MSQSQPSGAGPSAIPVETPALITTSLLVVSIVFPIIATISIIVRFYCLRIKSQSPKADDWVIVLALLMSWAQSINVFVAAAKAGVDTTTLPPLKAARIFLLCLWIEGFPLAICLPAIKISILLFYNRIFSFRNFRWSVYAAVAILTGWGISVFICQILAGDPVNSVWNPLEPKLRYNYRAFSLSVAGMSLIFDLLVLCFPLPVIRTLNMPTKRKVKISGIFWLGAFCCVAAAIRIYFLQAPASAAANKAYENATQSFIWAYIEPNISILTACLPTYGPLFIGKGGPSFISNLRSRIASLISTARGSSGDGGGSRSWRHKAIGESSDAASGNSLGKVNKNGSDVHDDGEVLILQDRIGQGKTASKESWMNVNYEGFVDTEIAGGGSRGSGGRGEMDLERGLGTDGNQIKPLGIMVSKGMRTEVSRAPG